MDLHLNDKAVLVTGGGSGIGRAAAKAFAAEGANVMIVGRDEKTLLEVVEEISTLGGSIRHTIADISDPDAARKMVDDTVAAFGGLDVAVNSAGITQDAGQLQELDTDLVRKVINVNLLGTFWSLQAEITAMRAHGGGSIINLTSMAAFTGTDGLSAYNATKHAILGLTRTAALENAQQGIRVNTVAPGTIETPMIEEFAASSDEDVMAPIREAHPMGRVGEADEVSGAILYLASDAASFTTGASISVDGGYIAR